MTGRLGLFVPTLQGGGAERVILNLAGGLIRKDREVDLVLCQAEGALRDAVPEGVRLVNLGAGGVTAAIPALARYLRAARPVGLLAAMDHANLAAILARRLSRVRTRIVASVHVDLTRLAGAEGQVKVRLVHVARKWLYPLADAVVAVSDGVADELARSTRLRRDRITVIHNPIVTPELLAAAGQVPDHPWFRASEPPVVLAVGRLEPQKDFATLLRAFALLRRRRPARLVILGRGSMQAVLQEQARSLGVEGDAWFGGFQANPHQFMRAAGVLVLSSAYEGFGNVLVEALACGTPVVSTDCPSGPAEILGQGRYGRLVPVGAEVEMAAAIEATLAAPPVRERLQERAGAFAVEAAVTKYLAVLDPEGCDA